MEAHDEFLSSLKRQGQIVEELARSLKIDDGVCSRAGVRHLLFKKIVSGDLQKPLDLITFDNLLRVFELKLSGFKKTPNCAALKMAWEATQKAFCKNGGSPLSTPDTQPKPEQFLQKKSAAWIIATFLKKLLKAHLINRERFQKETGTSRWIFESLLEQEWDLYKDDRAILTLIDYISLLLTDQEMTLIKTALENKFLCLSQQQIEMIRAPLSAKEIEERGGKIRPDSVWEKKSWKNKTREEILKEIFFAATSLRDLLKGLLFICDLEIADLAEEAGCSIRAINNLMAGKAPVEEKVAGEMIRAFNLNGVFANLFFKVVTTLKMPGHMYSNQIRKLDLVDQAKLFISTNLVYFVMFHRQVSFWLGEKKEAPTEQLPVSPEHFTQDDPPAESPMEVFARIIREGRLAKKLSLSEFAKRAECSLSTISKAEDGLAFPPKATIRKIAGIFGFKNEKKADFYKLAGISYY